LKLKFKFKHKDTKWTAAFVETIWKEIPGRPLDDSELRDKEAREQKKSIKVQSGKRKPDSGLSIQAQVSDVAMIGVLSTNSSSSSPNSSKKRRNEDGLETTKHRPRARREVARHMISYVKRFNTTVDNLQGCERIRFDKIKGTDIQAVDIPNINVDGSENHHGDGGAGSSMNMNDSDDVMMNLPTMNDFEEAQSVITRYLAKEMRGMPKSRANAYIYDGSKFLLQTVESNNHEIDGSDALYACVKKIMEDVYQKQSASYESKGK